VINDDVNMLIGGTGLKGRASPTETDRSNSGLGKKGN